MLLTSWVSVAVPGELYSFILMSWLAIFNHTICSIDITWQQQKWKYDFGILCWQEFKQKNNLMCKKKNGCEFFWPSASWCGRLKAYCPWNCLLFSQKKKKKRNFLGLQFSLKHDAKRDIFHLCKSGHTVTWGYLRGFRGTLWGEGDGRTHHPLTLTLYNPILFCLCIKCILLRCLMGATGGTGMSWRWRFLCHLMGLKTRLLREQRTTGGRIRTLVYCTCFSVL